MYEFSVPMPYNKEQTDKLVSINREIEKSRITSLYFSLPSTNELFTGFEQTRNQLLDKKDWAFWRDLAEYSVQAGFDVMYCLNMPRPLAIENPKFPQQIERLHKLLEELEKLGINKLRTASPKLTAYLHRNFHQFDLYGSTASDYKIIQEFQFLKQVHPYLKGLVPSHNANKNFTLLKNIKKLGLEVEIMVNEGCVQGCSNRFEHEACLTDSNFENQTKVSIFQEDFCKGNCTKIEQKNPVLYMAKGNHIYPWEIAEYEKIGINKFKLNGRDGIHNDKQSMTDMIETYLKGIEDIKNIEDIPVIRFASNSTNQERLQNLRVKDVKKYLPDIKHFVKYGDLCASRCGTGCRYCYKCAEKIQKKFLKQQKTEEIKSTPICTISGSEKENYVRAG